MNRGLLSASLFHLSLKISNIRAIFISLKQLVDIRIRGCEKFDIRCITNYNGVNLIRFTMLKKVHSFKFCGDF